MLLCCWFLFSCALSSFYEKLKQSCRASELLQSFKLKSGEEEKNQLVTKCKLFVVSDEIDFVIL